jgi:hypothetical protein
MQRNHTHRIKTYQNIKLSKKTPGPSARKDPSLGRSSVGARETRAVTHSPARCTSTMSPRKNLVAKSCQVTGCYRVATVQNLRLADRIHQDSSD